MLLKLPSEQQPISASLCVLPCPSAMSCHCHAATNINTLARLGQYPLIYTAYHVLPAASHTLYVMHLRAADLVRLSAAARLSS